MCYSSSIVSLSNVHPYQGKRYLNNGPDLMCRTNLLTVYSCLSSLRLFETVSLLDKDFGAFVVDVALSYVWLKCNCGKLFNVGIAGSGEIWSMDALLDLPLSSMLSVCDWTMIIRKRSMVVPKTFALEQDAKDDALLSFVVLSGSGNENQVLRLKWRCVTHATVIVVLVASLWFPRVSNHSCV